MMTKKCIQMNRKKKSELDSLKQLSPNIKRIISKTELDFNEDIMDKKILGAVCSDDLTVLSGQGWTMS